MPEKQFVNSCLAAKIVKQDEAENCDAMLCGPVSYYPDDIVTQCHFCKTKIVHRPHAPQGLMKTCIACGMEKLQGEKEFVMTDKTADEVSDITNLIDKLNAQQN